MNTAVEVQNIQSRLPMPVGLSDLDQGKWRVLCESIFPNANSPEAIVLAVDYCRARKLDIMKKPVNIVPMWSTKLSRYVETVWPSINEVQVTASRTGAYAGMDEPKWGNEITREFKGVTKGNVGETTVKLTYPESCAVTVYRMVDGQKCAFTEPVYWTEAYATVSKTELPNEQWKKRPRGMILKVAKAFSLRAAFPEEGEHTAEEMEGKTLEEVGAEGVIIDNDKFKKSSPFKNANMRKEWGKNVEDAFNRAISIDELDTTMTSYKPRFDEMQETSNEYDSLELDRLRMIYKQCFNRLAIASRETPEEDAGTFGEDEIPEFERKQMEDDRTRIAAKGIDC